MIVDKHPTSPVIQPEEELEQEQPSGGTTQVEEAYETNAMVEAYRAVRRILETIKEDPDDPDSPQLFKTIKLDNGQLSRVKNNKHNLEYGFAFPAVFIHFIDVYYNVGTSRIAESRGTMRIHYILNRLNNSDDEFETEGLEVYQRIVNAIEAQKTTFPSLVSRFQLQYWDQPLSFDDGLQPYWIDYQIWFNDYTNYQYKNYVDVYASHPPFTQHSDQNEIANPDNLPDNKDRKFEDVVGFDDFS